MTIKQELIEYAKDCINGDIPSCQKHTWACQRFLRDLERVGTDDFPYFWDERWAERIVKWFELLKHSKGELAGEPILLTTWQKFSMCQLYGWRHRETGYKRFRKSYKQVARKNAKSQEEAGIALFEISIGAMQNKEAYEYYTAGSKRDQSKIVFKECDLMTRNTLVRSKFNFLQNEIKHNKSGSFIKPLSRDDGKTGDGTNPAGLILDEYHQHQTTDFYDLGLGANRKEPLLMIITTAGKDLTYPCYTQEYEYCSKILNPDIDVHNETYFVDICEAERGDDYGDIKTWQKANPIRAFFDKGIEDIREEYLIAKEIPEKMISFLTKMLDMWVQAKENGYMDMAKWKACEVKEAPLDITNRSVYVGFDMSSKIDLTSVTFMFPFQQEKKDERDRPIPGYFLITHSFIPTVDKLREHIIKDKVPYDAWERLGYLTVTNTPIVDQSQVERYVYAFAKKHKLNIECLCFDPAGASKMMMDMSDDGYDVEEVYQSHKSLNESTQGFREQVYSGNVFYKHNPLLNYAMSNAVIRSNNGLIKIDKDMTTKRIDPVDSTLCAFKLALYHDFESQNYNSYLNTFLEEL